MSPCATDQLIGWVELVPHGSAAGRDDLLDAGRAERGEDLEVFLRARGASRRDLAIVVERALARYGREDDGRLPRRAEERDGRVGSAHAREAADAEGEVGERFGVRAQGGVAVDAVAR